jgi:hypothetical protein
MEIKSWYGTDVVSHDCVPITWEAAIEELRFKSSSKKEARKTLSLRKSLTSWHAHVILATVVD